MVIVINNDFSVAKIEPSTVYQGSDNATTLYVFAPFSIANYTAIKVNFELPNGEYTNPHVLFPTDEQPADDSGFGCWSMELPASVTEYSGKLKASLTFYGANGSVFPTATASINIASTVLGELPDKAEQDVYEQILAYLSSIANKFKSGVQNGYTITSVSEDKKTVYIGGYYSNMVKDGETVQVMINRVIPDWSATVESVVQEGSVLSGYKTAVTLSEALTSEFVERNTYLIFPNEPSKGNMNLSSHSTGFNAETEPRTFAASTFGTKTRSDAPNQLAGGTYNAPAPDSLFVMGNGESEDKRSNAGGLRKSGRYWQQSAPEKDDELVRLGDMNLKAIESIKFDDDGKLVITLNNGEKFTMNSGWLTDVSNGGALPPTAKAVKDYADKKADDAKSAAQTALDEKVPITKNDYKKVVTVGAEGNLDAIDPRTMYRHEMHIKSSQNQSLDIYCVFYNAKRTPTTDYYDFLSNAIGEGGMPCQGAVGTKKATRFKYEDQADENTSARIVITDNSNTEYYFTQWTLEDRVPEYDVGEIKSDVTEVKSDIEDITRRVDNLEDVLVEEKVETSKEYITPVPENVGRHALLNEVGGITRRVEKVLHTFADAEDELTMSSDTYSFATLDLSNVKAPVFLVADSISGDVKLYLSKAEYGSPYDAETYISPSKTEAMYGTNFDTCYLTYEIFEGAYSWENLRVVTYELQTSIPTAIESRGKNLIPFPYPELGGIGASVTKNGVTATVNEDGGISLTGTADNTGNGAVYFTLCYMKGLGETFYGKSWLDFNGGSNGTCYFSPRVMYDSGSEGVMVFIKDGEILNETIYPQIEYGTIGTEYAPYREPITYTLPEAITRRGEYGLGIVYKDKVYSNTIDFENKKYYPNRAKKKVYDGTENIYPNDKNIPNVFYITGFSGPYIDGICNHYPNITYNGLWYGSKNGILLENGHELRVRDMSVSDVDGLRSKLVEWAANGEPLTVIFGFDNDTEAEDIDVDDVIEVEPKGALVALNTNERGTYTKVSYIVAKGGSAE